jgi:hypothetical protein
MEIELLEAAQVVADAKCKSEGEKKKNADKPRNSVVEQMALMGSIQKTKAAFNDLALKLRQQAEVFFEWALETTAEDDERLGGFKTASKEVETRFTETFTALEETMKEKFKTWDGFAANTHTGNEYHDFSCQFAGAMKEFITTDKTYKEARGALKTWRDFKEATVRNLRKLEQEAIKDKARRSDLRATVKVADTPKIQNSMEQYMTANPDELKQNLNLKWTVKEDIHIVYTHIYMIHMCTYMYIYMYVYIHIYIYTYIGHHERGAAFSCPDPRRANAADLGGHPAHVVLRLPEGLGCPGHEAAEPPDDICGDREDCHLW